MSTFAYVMYITNEILSDFLYCPYKAYRKSNLEKGIISEYQELYDNLKETYTKQFKKTTAESIKFNVNFSNENINLTLDAIEYNDKSKIPICFVPFEKVTKADKLYIGLQATYIQNYFHYKIDFCKIIFGKNLRQTKIKMSSYTKTTKKHSFDLNKILSNTNPPLFFKNAHCQICEFHDSCLKKLIERDDLSLLAGLKPKEIQQKNDRGFFSVRQLSYTFRPKKNPYCKRKFLPELKALAIRENKTFIQEIPTFPSSETQIYLDIEGLPDRNFYYLIGVIIRNQDAEKEFSFWANNEDEEIHIFIELITLITAYSNYTVYHYGSYETQALNSVSKRLSSEYQNVMKNIIIRSFNILNIFTHALYPPTYSNGLKDIAKFLRFEWTDPNSSGLQSIIWRYKWELLQIKILQTKLMQYNIEDCKALIVVKSWIDNIPEEESKTYQRTNSVKIQSQYKFGSIDFLIKELEDINKFAYFNYQRDKVFIKTNSDISRKKKHLTKNNEKLKILIPDKIISIKTPTECHLCSSKTTLQDRVEKINIDLKITSYGIKRIVTKYQTKRYRCKSCNKKFIPQDFMCISKYGNNLLCWIINQIIHYRISGLKVSELLQETFGIIMNQTYTYAVKILFAKYYAPTFSYLFNSLKKGNLLHCDETTFKIEKERNYIWVFTNMNTVCYIFKPTREADFLKELFLGFNGVMISDFYAGYDAIDCPKQKCLIHLIRDINDDLMKNQQNEEYKILCTKFSDLLNMIILTINQYGLKNRHLNKHKKQVNQFFKKLILTEFTTELGESWKKKFLKYQTELFTFLDYDNIPWNNNNAEYAVKAVALYRKDVTFSTQKGLQEYLILLSIHETCKYRGINFFDFLKSGEINISEYESKLNNKHIRV